MRAGSRPKRATSDWRSVRRWAYETPDRLRRQHRLWLHGWCLGALVLLFMWVAAHLQMVLGSDSLALRYLVTLGIGYLGYLLVLRWWAGALVGERSGDVGLDLPIDLPTPGGGAECAAEPVQAFQSGGGGDFGGGGAGGSFELSSDGGAPVGDLASGALEAAGSADEGAVVVIPVVAVFLIGCAVVLGAGSLLLLYFGSEVLLAVAVEVAFGYVSARTAVRMAREGWLSAAVRLTWKPLLGALVCAVVAGGLVDYFVPQARSLPHAVQLWQAGR